MAEEIKRYTVEITDTAWNMLIGHAQFIAKVSPPAADRLVDVFINVCCKISASGS